MKRILQYMSPEERSAYRRWQAGWICFYVAVAVVLAGISSLLPTPRDIEMAQAASTAQRGR